MKENDICIRPMQSSDLDQVAALECRIFSQPWSRESFDQALKKTENIYLAALWQDLVVGYCGLWGVAGEGQIFNVAVSPEYRSRHIGTRLVQELLIQGELAGLDRYTLEVRAGNLHAIRLYENLGFYSAGIRKNFYALPAEDAVIMWRDPAIPAGFQSDSTV